MSTTAAHQVRQLPAKAGWWRSVALVGLVAAVHLQAAGFGYMVLDDGDYVTENQRVLAGLSAEGVWWAFTTKHAANWHPLTWLSLMLDATVWGSRPMGFHLTNVLLHGLNVWLLYRVIGEMTGAWGRGWVIAALWAVHPLHAESVAWVAERKDVLSTAGALASVWAYAVYARSGRAGWLAVCGAALMMSLMAKAMFVTLPALLLVLDFWPLERWRKTSWRRLCLEKVPLLIPCLIVAYLTVWAQAAGQAVDTLQNTAFELRLGNAVVAYGLYVRKLLLPIDLGAFYPHPKERLTGGAIGISAVLLAAMTVWSVVERRRRPYLLAGWLWFLGLLVPVIGVVQVGSQQMADRYAYLPVVGLWLGIVWFVADVAARAGKPAVGAGAGGVAIAVFAVAGFFQVRLWRDPVVLMQHTLAVTDDNPYGEYVTALAHLQKNELPSVRRHLERAVQLNLQWAHAFYLLGKIQLQAGEPEPATQHLASAARLKPGDALAWKYLGMALHELGRLDEAAQVLEESRWLNADDLETLYLLGLVTAARGDGPKGLELLSRAARGAPDEPRYVLGLGTTLAQLGQPAEAERVMADYLTRWPDDPVAWQTRGVAAIAVGNWNRARECFDRLVALQPGSPEARYLSGITYRKLGNEAAARAELQQALRLAPGFVPAARALEASPQD